MRFIIPIMALVMILSCNGRMTKEQKVASHFLTAFYNYNFDDASSVATQKTVEQLKEMQKQIGKLPAKGTYHVPIIEILECYVTDSIAQCRYIIKNDENDDAAISENLELVKENGEWKVNYFKK